MHQEIKTSPQLLAQHLSASVSVNPSVFSSLPPFKPHFHISVKLIFEAFHTFMLICPRTFVAQQHASLSVAPAFARMHTGLIRASQSHLLASLITLEQQGSMVYAFMVLFIDKNRLDTFFPLFCLFAQSIPQNCCLMPAKAFNTALR